MTQRVQPREEAPAGGPGGEQTVTGAVVPEAGKEEAKIAGPPGAVGPVPPPAADAKAAELNGKNGKEAQEPDVKNYEFVKNGEAGREYPGGHDMKAAIMQHMHEEWLWKNGRYAEWLTEHQKTTAGMSREEQVLAAKQRIKAEMGL